MNFETFFVISGWCDSKIMNVKYAWQIQYSQSKTILFLHIHDNPHSTFNLVITGKIHHLQKAFTGYCHLHLFTVEVMLLGTLCVMIVARHPPPRPLSLHSLLYDVIPCWRKIVTSIISIEASWLWWKWHLILYTDPTTFSYMHGWN